MHLSWQVRRFVLRTAVARGPLSRFGPVQPSSGWAPVPPVNDNLVDATLLTTSGTYYAQSSESTAGATTESGEPINNSIGSTVWYVWQSPDYPVNVTATTAAYTDIYNTQL